MILPADCYVVYNKSIITDLDKKVIMDLYQKIIGNDAVSLYFTLLNDLNNGIMTQTLTHHHLLCSIQVSLSEIQVSREKLEAIGLLKTYVKKDSVNKYIYVLYSPISPSEFFNNPILNVILYNNLGKSEYQNLVNLYKLPKIQIKEYEDISKSFDEVYTSYSTEEFVNNDDIININKNKLIFSKFIDFELLVEGLVKFGLSEKNFSKEIKDLINNLCFIYNIDVLAMQNLIRNVITVKGNIDTNELRKSARSYYQFEHAGSLPKLIYSKQPEYLKTPVGATDRKAKMIYTFENTIPREFLKSKYKDGKVITRDLQIIESLLLDLKLTPGVINVLVDYVLKVNNQKLNRNYIETIGANFKRLGIETVPEAMNACIKEYKKFNKTKTKSTKTINVTPEWFDKNFEKEKLQYEDEEELNNLIKEYN